MPSSMSQTQSGQPQDVRSTFRHNVRLDRIEHVSIDSLKRFDRRLRKRSDAAFEKLKSSVTRFGIVMPILINADRKIIAGEGIVDAARALGFTEVPIVRADHLNEAEARLLRIALNKLAETSNWDSVELAEEFRDLVALDVDLDIDITGFNTIEIDNLLQSPAAIGEDPDDEQMEVDEAGIAISTLGDIWRLGDHRVLNGSSLEISTIALLMAGASAQMVMTDHPYNVRIAGFVSGPGKHKRREFAQASGEMSEDEFVAFLTTSIAALSAHCVDGALLYMFMDWRHQWEVMSAIRANGLTLINTAIWVKSTPSMGSFYRSQHEFCYIARKGAASHQNNIQLGRYGRNRSNVWTYPGVNAFGRGREEQLAMHPTCKNVVMLADAIRDCTSPGDIVLDGFLGSGTTLIAAERTGRICYGVEIDPLYVDTIIRRWKKATGKTATLDATGETFAEVTERRARERDMPRPEIVAPRRVRAIAA